MATNKFRVGCGECGRPVEAGQGVLHRVKDHWLTFHTVCGARCCVCGQGTGQLEGAEDPLCTDCLGDYTASGATDRHEWARDQREELRRLAREDNSDQANGEPGAWVP